jgi:outer membrane receptor for ferrienterochelin and colicin
MQNKHLIILFTFFLTQNLIAQKKITISGYVEDVSSGEKLISSAVFDSRTKLGTVTNNYGFFSLTLPQDSVFLVASYVGYTPLSISTFFERDTLITISLKPSTDLQELEVNATRQDRIENQVQMSQTTLPIDMIKKIPALLGEVDVLKVLQLLPGVKFGAEGTNGLYVRGGGADQNLILLDGVPVYNASHIGGLFSVFNGDAIKSVRLTKGGFPARFGGRLSSVIEIDMKEGNMKKWHAEGGIGLISSRLTLEGPLLKDKISCMFSARRTYADIFLSQRAKSEYQAINAELKEYALYFYDLNAKVNYRINDKHRIFLSAYNGLDKQGEVVQFLTNDDFKKPTNLDGSFNKWGNLTAALRWNWVVSNKFFVNTSVTRSNYFFDVFRSSESPYFMANGVETASKNKNAFNYVSTVSDWTVRSDMDFLPNPKHHIRMGLGSSFYTFSPGNYTLKSSVPKFDKPSELVVQDTSYGNRTISANAPFVYVEDEINLGKLTANVGLHATMYLVEKIRYPSVQPRLGVSYRVATNAAVKASFSVMRQFVNLLTNDGLGYPTDLWVSSTKRLLPQESWQVALGYAKSYGDDYELSVETYYKDMKNVLSYREGASYIDVVDLTPWEEKVTQGTGNAYGLECFLQKKTGRWTGWVSYTLAWNNRQFDDINNGNPFPFRYDRRHELAITGSYQLKKNISISGNWVFATSNPITPPSGVFFYPVFKTMGQIDPFTKPTILYGERNSFRPTAYHRLDVNIDFIKKQKKYERKWSVGIFNVYDRANAFYFQAKSDGSLILRGGPNINTFSLQKVSLIPFLPSVSYNLKW